MKWRQQNIFSYGMLGLHNISNAVSRIGNYKTLVKLTGVCCCEGSLESQLPTMGCSCELLPPVSICSIGWRELMEIQSQANNTLTIEGGLPDEYSLLEIQIIGNDGLKIKQIQRRTKTNEKIWLWDWELKMLMNLWKRINRLDWTQRKKRTEYIPIQVLSNIASYCRKMDCHFIGLPIIMQRGRSDRKRSHDNVRCRVDAWTNGVRMTTRDQNWRLLNCNWAAIAHQLNKCSILPTNLRWIAPKKRRMMKY